MHCLEGGVTCLPRTHLTQPPSLISCAAACRLVMICNNISKVLDAVRSRTLPVRVAAPTEEEVCDLLQHVARKENIILTPEFAAKVGAFWHWLWRRRLCCAN